MKLVDLVNFFKSPPDREIIRRWTTEPGPRPYLLQLPAPPDPERFNFLVLGDSGDSAGTEREISPQDAVARFMAEDAALPGSAGDAHLVLHLGDVVYMTGERRLYDRNFRRPYAAFLAPDSTVDHLVFRMPFLPVPGNHDYYDFGGWGAWLAGIPLVGRGIAAVARELFSFTVPQGGSGMGAAYMQAFVDPDSARNGAAYVPGSSTRVPNRYYRFRIGKTDFFALDSNTLDAPPPTANLQAERDAARECIETLEVKARALTREIDRDKLALEHWLEQQRRETAADPERLADVRAAATALDAALERVLTVLRPREASAEEAEALRSAEDLHSRWSAAAEALTAAQAAEERAEALERLADVDDDICPLLEKLEYWFAELPEGPERGELLRSRDSLIEANRSWCRVTAGAPPPHLCERLQRLTANALEVQRELALEKRRLDRRPEDYDSGQLEWLRQAIEESVRDNPDGWRIVYLHQPLYTSIGDHSENADVVGVRENLMPLLRDRVHLVLAGHARAFEWFRSAQLPTTALIVSGGGGQRWLWPSILEPRRLRRFRQLYRSLQEGGAQECVAAGHGPAAPDGEEGPLYHYVRVEVTPEVLRVAPIGVRQVGRAFRREIPLPVYHVPEFPACDSGADPGWEARQLEALEIRRGRPPQPRWA